MKNIDRMTRIPSRTYKTAVASFAAGLVLLTTGPVVDAAARPKATTKRVVPGTAAPTTTLAAPTASTAPARKKMVVGTISEPGGLDPAAVPGDMTAQPSIIAIYDQLVDTPWGKSPQPGLAESFVESPDRKSWTLKIRSGVKFHDGTDLNAEAVRFNLERYRKSRVTAGTMSVIKSVDVTDPMTVRLTLDKPFGALPDLLGSNVGIMVSPKAIQEKADILNRQPTDAGTGPYILKEWIPADHITVVSNPNYWGNPKPHLEQITFKVVLDDQSRLAALQAGDVQSMVTPVQDTANRGVKAGFRLVEAPASFSSAIFFNNSKPPFDDIRMRRAAALALDIVAIGNVLDDAAAPNQGFGLWPKDNLWYSPSQNTPGFDRATARSLVNDYIKSTGRDASFTIIAPNVGSAVSDALRLTVKYWSDAGIAVKVVELPDINSAVIALATSQYEAAALGVALNKDPDPTAFNALSSTSPTNFSRYKNVEMDAALDQGRTAGDQATRKAAYARVQDLFRRDVPFLVGSSGTLHILSAKTVCGIEPTGGFPAKTVGIGNC